MHFKIGKPLTGRMGESPSSPVACSRHDQDVHLAWLQTESGGGIITEFYGCNILGSNKYECEKISNP
jgi:hypothetical protein